MTDDSAALVLAPELAAKLADFARACKAAARAVSLYPAGHPAIEGSLARLAELTARLTETGPFRIQVAPDRLLVDGAAPARPDAAIGELSSLLRRHLIGALTVNSGADAESWRTLFLLLARPPEEVRADGGITRLWSTAGGPSVEITEVDYAEVLREKKGLAETIEGIIAAATAGPDQPLDEGTLAAFVEIVGDPGKLEALLQRLGRLGTESPQGVEAQTAAFLKLVRGLVDFVSRNEPKALDAIFEQLGRGARHFSVEAMISLLAERSRPEAMAGSVNVVSALIENMADSSVAGFVAASVVAERGATERLAHAFRSLVPEFDRQRQLLALARDEVAASDLGDDEGFPELWRGVERMMTSYTDARYVSDDYARELSRARMQPVDVERTSDDPPDRIAAWLATVSDAALRGLDRDLLTDLLSIETDPLRWRDVAETVVSHADDLMRVGHFDHAWHLLETVVEQGRRELRRQVHATAALDRVAQGPLARHAAAYLKSADEAASERFMRLCHAIGPGVIAPLAGVLAGEQDARVRRRLRDLLVAFGPRGADAVRPLMNAADWEVRRTAAFLLREFGGMDALKELVPLLTDREPLVRREAVQGLLLNGSEKASAILLDALLRASGDARESLLNEITTMRDGRAGPLFAYLLQHMDRRQMPRLYATAIEALGSIGGPDAIEGLTTAMMGGDWRTPFANRQYRLAAARSLARIGTPAAVDALRAVAARGPRGARAAARAVLTGLAGS